MKILNEQKYGAQKLKTFFYLLIFVKMVFLSQNGTLCVYGTF